MEAHFEPSIYDDQQGNLFKLTQIRSVAEYQTEFDRICNWIDDLMPSSVISWFISELRPCIRVELTPCLLPDISTTFGLAKHIVTKLNYSTILTTTEPIQPKNTPMPSITTTRPQTRPPLLSLSQIPIANNPNSKSTLHISQLSPTEQHRQQTPRLCFSSNKWYCPSHQCQNYSTLLLIEVSIPYSKDEKNRSQMPQLKKIYCMPLWTLQGLKHY